MAVLGIIWVVTTPYVFAIFVGRWSRLNAAVARNLVLATLVGWAALAVLVYSAVMAEWLFALVSAPFAGLSFWKPGRRPEPPADPDDPEPEPSPTRAGVRPRQRPRPVQPAPPRVRGGRAPSRTAPRRS